MAFLWRVLFMATLAIAVRVDDEEEPAGEGDAAQGAHEAGSNDVALAQAYHPQKPCYNKNNANAIPQESARAAAVGAHAASMSPSEVVKAAAEASKCASSVEDPPKAKEEAELAAERALGFPAEVEAAGANAYSWTSMRKGRSSAELAAADVAKVAQDEAEASGSAFMAAVAAHTEAMKIEGIDGSGRGYMYGVPPEPTTTEAPEVAKTRGLYAMWQAFRAGETPGAVVDAAVEATKRAGGLPSDVEDIVDVASDPMTFETVEQYSSAEDAGVAAAKKANAAGWPLPQVAMAAMRAAADAQEANPGQDPDDALQAGRDAAEWAMKSAGGKGPEEVAAAAAEKAKKKAEDYGHPPAKVQQLVTKAAAAAAQKQGAAPDLVAKVSADARNTVNTDPSGDWETQQWNKRVYVEYDKKEAADSLQKEAVDKALGGDAKEGEAAEGAQAEGDEKSASGSDSEKSASGSGSA